MIWRKLVAIFSMTLLLTACSSDTKELPPAKLVKFNPETDLKVVWSRSVGDGQGDLYNRLTPAIDGSTIYAADIDGVVMAMDRYDGTVRWKKKLKRPISGGVSAAYGVVLVGTLKGEVIALDNNTGDERWRVKVNSEVLSAPVTNGNIVVVQTGADTLFGFDIVTGKQLWRYDNYPAVLTLRGTSTPVITNNIAVFGLSTGHVIALDPNTGVPVWEQVIAMPKGRSELERMVDIDGKLLLAGSTLYAVTYQGQAAALELNSGRILWQRLASSYTGLTQNLDTVFLSLADGTVQAIDEKNVSELWANNQLARRQLSGPASFYNYIAVADFEGYLHLMSQADGHFVARLKIDGNGVRVEPLAVDNIIYVYGNGGKLEALSIK